MATTTTSKTSDTVPDHLKCPICMDIPSHKVFQCVNGHPICGDCSSQITTCPQCRVQFGTPQIRNLVMETMLNELTLECPYKDSGCQSTAADRKHLKSCYYNTTKFGPLVNVCQTIFTTNCTFRMNKGNAGEAIQHFEKCHRARTIPSNNCRTNLSAEFLMQAEKSINLSLNFQAELPTVKNSKVVNSWDPVILKADKHFFLNLGMFSANWGTLSWASFVFPDSSAPIILTEGEGQLSSSPSPQYKVKCVLGYDEINSLTWKLSSVDILTTRELTTHYTMPMTTFVSQFARNGKTIYMKMKVKKITKRRLSINHVPNY